MEKNTERNLDRGVLWVHLVTKSVVCRDRLMDYLSFIGTTHLPDEPSTNVLQGHTILQILLRIVPVAASNTQVRVCTAIERVAAAALQLRWQVLFVREDLVLGSTKWLLAAAASKLARLPAPTEAMLHTESMIPWLQYPALGWLLFPRYYREGPANLAYEERAHGVKVIPSSTVQGQRGYEAWLAVCRMCVGVMNIGLSVCLSICLSLCLSVW